MKPALLVPALAALMLATACSDESPQPQALPDDPVQPYADDIDIADPGMPESEEEVVFGVAPSTGCRFHARLDYTRQLIFMKSAFRCHSQPKSLSCPVLTDYRLEVKSDTYLKRSGFHCVFSPV